MSVKSILKKAVLGTVGIASLVSGISAAEKELAWKEAGRLQGTPMDSCKGDWNFDGHDDFAYLVDGTLQNKKLVLMTNDGKDNFKPFVVTYGGADSISLKPWQKGNTTYFFFGDNEENVHVIPVTYDKNSKGYIAKKRKEFADKVYGLATDFFFLDKNGKTKLYVGKEHGRLLELSGYVEEIKELYTNKTNITSQDFSDSNLPNTSYGIIGGDVADIDGNGLDDLIYNNRNGDIYAQLQQHDGSFRHEHLFDSYQSGSWSLCTFPLSNGRTAIATGDVSGDVKLHVMNGMKKEKSQRIKGYAGGAVKGLVAMKNKYNDTDLLSFGENSKLTFVPNIAYDLKN